MRSFKSFFSCAFPWKLFCIFHFNHRRRERVFRSTENDFARVAVAMCVCVHIWLRSYDANANKSWVDVWWPLMSFVASYFTFISAANLYCRHKFTVMRLSKMVQLSSVCSVHKYKNKNISFGSIVLRLSIDSLIFSHSLAVCRLVGCQCIKRTTSISQCRRRQPERDRGKENDTK